MENICDYIANDSPLYARLNSENIVKSIERLQNFPESGRHLPEFRYLPHREVITGKYRVVYRYDSNSNAVKIITVLHGNRLLTESVFTE